MTFDVLKPKIATLISDSNSKDLTLQLICELLKTEIPHYDWVGFYFKNGDKKELKLGPYSGTPTDHTIIPFGKGICGQVAVSNQNFVVPDVKAQDNYIACSINVNLKLSSLCLSMVKILDKLILIQIQPIHLRKPMNVS